jgi:hypothetical protein
MLKHLPVIFTFVGNLEVTAWGDVSFACETFWQINKNFFFSDSFGGNKTIIAIEAFEC